MYFLLCVSTVYLVFGIVHSLWIWSKASRLDLCLNVLTGYEPGGSVSRKWFARVRDFKEASERNLSNTMMTMMMEMTMRMMI